MTSPNDFYAKNTPVRPLALKAVSRIYQAA
jgi:hypothetical protein